MAQHYEMRDAYMAVAREQAQEDDTGAVEIVSDNGALVAVVPTEDSLRASVEVGGEDGPVFTVTGLYRLAAAVTAVADEIVRRERVAEKAKED